MRKKVSQIDFSDSSYQSFEMNDRTLNVFLNSWDEKKIKITFFNAIFFLFRSGSFTSEFCENSYDSCFITEILSHYYEKIPEDHNYKVYSLIDIEDFEFIKVMSKNVSVIKY